MFNLFRRKNRYLNVTFDQGDKNNATLVFLHGIAATSNTWKPMEYKIDYTNYRVVALDLLGFGDSPKPESATYTADEHSKYINRTLKKLRVKGPFIIIGHSMGAIIAANYAGKWPEKIKAAILVGAPIYIKDKNLVSKRAVKMTNAYLKIYTYLELQKEFTIKNSRRLRKLLRIDDGIDVNKTNWHSFKSSLKNTIINQNTYETICNSTVPFYLITGSLDEFSIKENIRLLAKQDNVESVFVKRSDHAVDSKISRQIMNTIYTINGN